MKSSGAARAKIGIIRRMSLQEHMAWIRRRRALFPDEAGAAREEVRRHRALGPEARLRILFELQAFDRQMEALAPWPDRRRANALKIEEEGNARLRAWIRRYLPL